MKTLSLPGLRFVNNPTRRRLFRDNTLDIFTAEIWAREALLALQGNLTIGNYAYRDFSDQVARFGDVVNVARPGTFSAKRKGALCEEIQIQDASADSFQVPLDQYLYVSFKICDGEENRQMVDLVNTLMYPAMLAVANKIDIILGGQHIHFWNNSAGHLLGMNVDNINDYLVDTREVMNVNKVPTAGRRMSLTGSTEANMLKTGLFVNASSSGSDQTLRNGQIGRLYGFDFFTASNQPQVRSGQAAITAAVNHGNGYGPGTTTITIDAASTATVPIGTFAVFAGDDTPQRVTASNVATNAGDLTITPGLKYGVADNAAVTIIKPGAVNSGGGYAGNVYTPRRRVGYAKDVLTDGWTAGTAPQTGQPVAFGTDAAIYTIIEVSSTDASGASLPANSYNIQLDRPLDTDLANDESVNLGPAGNYNFAFTDSSLAAVFRPLPKPRTGGLASVVNDQGFSVRVVISYDPKQQAHIVTLDLLMGVGVYDEHTGAVMFG